jgi:hypothetical protein
MASEDERMRVSCRGISVRQCDVSSDAGLLIKNIKEKKKTQLTWRVKEVDGKEKGIRAREERERERERWIVVYEKKTDDNRFLFFSLSLYPFLSISRFSSGKEEEEEEEKVFE